MSEQPRKNDDQLVSQVRRTLDMGAEELDAVTLARLRAMRRQAVAELGARAERRTWWWVPAATFATAAVAAMVFSVWNGDRDFAPGAELSELEILADAEALEMLEDLEFYEWLAASDATAG
jgi:hypothetical protein